MFKMKEKELPEYETPTIVTYNDEEILEELVRYSPIKSNRIIQNKVSSGVLAS